MPYRRSRGASRFALQQSASEQRANMRAAHRSSMAFRGVSRLRCRHCPAADPEARLERHLQGRHRLRHASARADPARDQPVHGRPLARHGRAARHRDLGLDLLPAQRAAHAAPRLAQGGRRHGARQGRQGDARPLRLRARHLQLAVSGAGLPRREPGGGLRQRAQRLAGGRMARQGPAPEGLGSAADPVAGAVGGGDRAARRATSASCRC